MKFSVITPSFRGSDWLKLCVASVADQEVDHEHIVQDSCSDDGTQDWLPHDPRVRAFVEKDAGMYDAVNRGLRRANGEILAYLNCDEQYLPGALSAVERFFAAHPEVEVVFADAVVVDSRGQYLCERRALTPQRAHSLVSGNLAFLTCATFFRRRLLDKQDLFFDAALRDVGDVTWGLKLIEQKARMAVLSEFTSAFTDTGANMNLRENARREKRMLLDSAPWWAWRFRALVILHFRLRRWRAGFYSPKPHEYSIYTAAAPGKRRTFRVDRPTWRWRRAPDGH
jgi:glycosyltransferase involved in cell wall biosynthesis